MRHIALALALLLALSTPGFSAAPWFGLVTPSNGQEVCGSNVEISVSYDTATDEAVTYVELLMDGARVQERTLDEYRTRGICSFIWDASGYANGKHKVTVKLYSGEKLIGSTSGTFKVANQSLDGTPPTIEYFNIKPGQLLKGQVEVQLRATDDSGTAPLVSIFIDSQLKLIKNSPPYAYLWDTTLYDDGMHVVEAWAYDASGNRTVAKSVQVAIKNQMAPVELAQKVKPAKTPALANTVEPKGIKNTTKPIIASSTPVTVPAVKPVQVAAVPKELPAVKTEAARAVVPSVSSGGGAITTMPVIEHTGPLVEFIDSDYSISETRTTLVEPEIVTPTADIKPAVKVPAEKPVVKVVEPKPLPKQSVVAKVVETPAVGAALGAAALIAPSVSIPKLSAKPAKMALLPSSEYKLAPAKSFEPNLNAEPAAKPASAATPAGKMKAEIYGEKFTIDTAVMKGIPTAPLRQIWEHTGGQLFWHPESQTVKGYSREVDLELTIGNKSALVNNTSVFMPIAPYLDNGRAMVGLSFLQQAFRMDLQYDDKTGEFALVVQ